MLLACLLPPPRRQQGHKYSKDGNYSSGERAQRSQSEGVTVAPNLPRFCHADCRPPAHARTQFKITVPCSSANLACGFGASATAHCLPSLLTDHAPPADVLGLTLKLYLSLTVTSSASAENKAPELVCTGLGAEQAPLNPYKNLITRVALYVLRCHSIPHFPTGLRIECHNEIPFGRGLGSSGAAVIAGVLLADQVGELQLSQSRQLDFALMVERHPDNVAAALLGGFVGSYLKELSPEDTSATQIPLSEVLPELPEGAEHEEWGMNPPIPPRGIGHWLKFGWAKEVKAIVCIPDFEVPTAKAREVMPKSYPIKDVVCYILLVLGSIWSAVLIYTSPSAGFQPPAHCRSHARPHTVTSRL